MRKTIVGTVLALSLIGLSGTASAASPSQRECEASGGTFDRNGGDVTCTFVTEDPVGNSESSGGKSQTTTTTETEESKGTLKNRPKFSEDSECTGPGNSGPGGGQCP